MAIKKQADYWALAEYIVDPRKMVVVGTYALWVSEAEFKAGNPALTTAQVRIDAAAVQSMDTTITRLEEAMMSTVLQGGVTTP